MNRIDIVGLGPGNLEFITGAGINSIKDSEIVIGGSRQLADIEPLLENQEKYVMKKLDAMLEYMKGNRERKISIIVSGDTGFYSLLEFLKRNFPMEELRVIPGISSFQYLFSRVGKSWHSFRLCSVHGRAADYIEAFKESQGGVILLTDKFNTPYEIGKRFYESGFPDVLVTAGENLSYPDEVITTFQAKDYEKHDRIYEMNVVMVEKGE